MFVTAPRRNTNGITDSPQRTYGVDKGVYPTFAEALSHAYDTDSSVTSGFSARTMRSEMQNGRTGPGTFVNTSYRAMYVNNKRTSDYVHVHSFNPSAHFVVRRQIGFGFDGFGDAGVGSPWMQFEPSGTNGRTSAVLNRAIMSNLLARAETECLVKARDQKLDLAESLVDIDRSIVMIGRRAAQVMSAYRHARAGRFDKVAEVLGISGKQIRRRGVLGNSKAIAEQWLEFQYGWKPLLNDIRDGMQLANDGLSRSPYLLAATRRLQEGLPFVERDVAPQWNDESLSADATCSVEVKFRFNVSNPNLAYLTGLGLENPAYIAWVALPMSFIVDWFLPVSDWLSALSAPLGLTFVSGYATTRSWGRIEYVRRKLYTSPSTTHISIAKGETDFGHIRRTVYSSFPVPNLYFRFPFNSWERVASAIALFIATNRGR